MRSCDSNNKKQNFLTEQLQVIRASLLTEKICQNKLNYSAEVCANLTQLEDTQHEVQRHVTDYEALFKTLTIVPK